MPTPGRPAKGWQGDPASSPLSSAAPLVGGSSRGSGAPAPSVPPPQTPSPTMTPGTPVSQERERITEGGLQHTSTPAPRAPATAPHAARSLEPPGQRQDAGMRGRLHWGMSLTGPPYRGCVAQPHGPPGAHGHRPTWVQPVGAGPLVQGNRGDLKPHGMDENRWASRRPGSVDSQ